MRLQNRSGCGVGTRRQVVWVQEKFLAKKHWAAPQAFIKDQSDYQD
jgi:hypothetical protein